MSDRYSRNESLFGLDGQRAIAETRVAVVGMGGLGSHVVQQLAYLGTEDFALADDDHVTTSSMNRLVTADDSDVAAETAKVEAARRRIHAINPGAKVRVYDATLDVAADELLQGVDIVFGCVDNDLTRLALTRHCAKRALPLFDAATDVDTEATPMTFGGRVVCCTGNGCLVCLDVLDQKALARAAQTPEQARADEAIYGVRRTALGTSGPMVVSINGTVASLAVTEFIALVTGLRPVTRYQTYYGHSSRIMTSRDEAIPDCYYCDGLWRRS